MQRPRCVMSQLFVNRWISEVPLERSPGCKYKPRCRNHNSHHRSSGYLMYLLSHSTNRTEMCKSNYKHRKHHVGRPQRPPSGVNVEILRSVNRDSISGLAVATNQKPLHKSLRREEHKPHQIILESSSRLRNMGHGTPLFHLSDLRVKCWR